MVAKHTPHYDDNSMGIKRSELPDTTPRNIRPISAPLAQREGPLTPPENVTRIPRAPVDDRSVADIQTTLLPKPAPDITPIPEFTRNGKTSYVIDKYGHPTGGFVEYTAILGRDGSGVIWWQDTNWNHGGLSISMTFAQIAALYAAACDARKNGCNLTDPDKEGA